MIHTKGRRASGSQILFVFAHQDDEVAVASKIMREVRLGRSVYCVYLSDGATKKVSAGVRCAESLSALRSLGVPPDNVGFIGVTSNIANKKVVDHMDDALDALLSWMANKECRPQEIVCLAWEGGHPDHDASHLVALGAAAHHGVLENTSGFSIYNGFGTSGKFFRVMEPIPSNGVAYQRKLPFHDGLRCAMLCTRYPSQWKTWLGLLPGTFLKYVIYRREILVAVNVGATLARPHAGSLLYERMFSETWPDFFSRSASFRKRLSSILSPSGLDLAP